MGGLCSAKREGLALFLSLATILTGTAAHSYFRFRIPNGFAVSHPCGPAYVWRGVGHEAYLGGGVRNNFGLDFKANGLEWNQAICEMDSDSDGQTNGEELGDPDCTWTPGSQPNKTTGLSHPGVCEPLNSTQCQGKNDFVNCSDLCDGVKEDGVFRQTVTISPQVAVPSQQMLHKCMVFDLPRDGDYHLIAAAPQIVDFTSLSHITVKGCSGDQYNEEPGFVHDCYMNSECRETLFHWAMGDDDICFHPDTGFRVGNHSTAYRRGLLAVHLYNPGTTEQQDSSGINLFFTASRRAHDAGIFFFGQRNLNIPPQAADYVVSGGCSGGCTAQKMKGAINVPAAFNHMHHTGVKAVSQRIVDEKRVDYIAYDETFSYDNPKYHRFADPLRINPGDRLNIECHYNTMTRNMTSHFGRDAYNDEMCHGYLMYYPKENMELSFCQDFGDLDNCDFEAGIIKGCNISKLNYGDPDNVPEFNAVQTNCRAGICLRECMSLLETVRRHPCYTGSLRQHELMMAESDRMTAEEKNNFLSFWLKMSSCDKEFAAMEKDDDTSAASGPAGSLHPFMAFALLLTTAITTI